MEGKAEESKMMGAFGIVGETFTILRDRHKQLRTIFFARILPLCLVSLLHDSMAMPIAFKIFAAQTSLRNGENHEEQRTLQEFPLRLTGFLIMEVLYAVYTFGMWWLSTAAVVDTAAFVYAGKKKSSFATVKKVDPTLSKRTVITSSWFFIMSIAMLMVFGFAVSLLMWGSCQLNGLIAWLFRAVILFICQVLLCMCLYMTMVWHVASVVTVMEEKYYGFEALKKSHRLIEGKRDTVMALTLLYFVAECLHGYAVVSFVNWDGAGRMESFGYGALLVALARAITLVWTLTKSVFYFVCKSHQGEFLEEVNLLGEEHLPLISNDIQPDGKHLLHVRVIIITEVSSRLPHTTAVLVRFKV